MTTNPPLVSIAMCTYNGERFLEEQLDSILNQTYRNLEIIISDDCSTDNTINIIREYSLLDKRIKSYENKQNLGFLKNFEKAISLCDGKYIALADQDDIWKLNKINTFIKKIKNNILIYSDAILIDKFSKELNLKLIEPKKNLIKNNNNKAFLFDNCVSGNTLMFKKELLKYILPIPKAMNFHDTWIALIASTIGTITYTTEALTYYRRYDEQVTSKTKRVYKSFFDKFTEKKNLSISSAKNSLILYSQLLKLDFLDSDLKHLLNLLQNHYNNFEDGLFNFELYSYLQKNKDELFAIRSKKRRNANTRKISMKLKLHELLLFSS